MLQGRGLDAPVVLPWAGTFHSAGAKLLRLYAERIGLSPDFTIHDRGDSEDLMGLVRSALPIDATQRRFPSGAACAAIYSRAVNAQQSLRDVLRDSFPRWVEWEAELQNLFGAYVEAKQSQCILDFDDLLLYWEAMLGDGALADETSALFDHVLVDEYQDTNRLQGAILARLRPDGRGVTVVGDDAQAIYGFRAADVRNILDFPQRFSPPATVMTLAVNYRSVQSILDASNAVIRHATERFTKDLAGVRGQGTRPALVAVRDEADQARYVAEQVLASREQGIELKAQAVLFRTSSHSAPLELELARRNIPFVKYGGLKFLDAAHVKDVLCVLRFAHNERDRLAGFRVLRLLPGVGPRDGYADARRGRRFTPGRGGALAGSRRVARAAALAAWRVARRGRRRARVVRTAPRTDPRGRAVAHARPGRTGANRRDVSVARALPHRDHARPAVGDRRDCGSPAPRRRLPRAVDHPLREGAGMEERARAERRRRLHPVGHGHRTRARTSRRSVGFCTWR